MQKIYRCLFLLPIVSAAFLSLASTPTPVPTPQSEESKGSSWPIEFVAPELADRDRPHGRREDAASRGKCDRPENGAPLTALTPSHFLDESTNPYDEIVMSLTTRPHPDFWFYLPFQLDGSLEFEFVLQDSDGMNFYKAHFAPETDDPGILKVSLPESSPMLAVGRDYRWFFVIHCDENNKQNIEGWIGRVELREEIEEKIDRASPMQKVALYTDRGIWQDALMTLGTLYRDNPNSEAIAAEWLTLLESVGLEDIAQEEFLSSSNIEI